MSLTWFIVFDCIICKFRYHNETFKYSDLIKRLYENAKRTKRNVHKRILVRDRIHDVKILIKNDTLTIEIIQHSHVEPRMLTKFEIEKMLSNILNE
jgi:predicted CopG family antitoxin